MVLVDEKNNIPFVEMVIKFVSFQASRKVPRQRENK